MLMVFFTFYYFNNLGIFFFFFCFVSKLFIVTWNFTLGQGANSGPWMTAVRHRNVRREILTAGLGTLRESVFIWCVCAIINNHWHLKTSGVWETNKASEGAHVYLPALNEITEWKRRHSLINSDSCVQKSQLVGLNHYLACAHLTFSFDVVKKNPAACRWSDIVLQLSMLMWRGLF